MKKIFAQLNELDELDRIAYRVFHKHTPLAIMPILSPEALPRENKKIQ